MGRPRKRQRASREIGGRGVVADEPGLAGTLYQVLEQHHAMSTGVIEALCRTVQPEEESQMLEHQLKVALLRRSG